MGADGAWLEKKKSKKKKEVFIWWLSWEFVGSLGDFPSTLQ